MTIVGEAELDVRAVGNHFSADLNQVVKPGMAQAGAAAETAAGRGKKAFSLMFSTIRDSSSGAFAPVVELMSHVENVMDDLHAKSLALKATAAGAAGLGVGTGLQAFASKEQAAQAQLSDAISNTGHVYEEYGNQIEKTVKHGEHFGVQSYQTMDVLNRLTLATNDPAKALKDYQVVLDMAAARHMSVTRAAQMLASAYGGNTRIFRMFGLSVANQNKELADAKKADETAATAADKLKKARQNLADVEARIGAGRRGHAASAAQLASAEARVGTATAAVQVTEFKHGQQSPQATAARDRLAAAEANLAKVRAQGTGSTKLTVAQEIELRKAHDAVTTAEQKVTDATATKTKADAAAKDAAQGVDGIIAQLSTRLSGQAASSVDNFSGRVHAMTAEVEDQVSSFGAHYGPALTTASSGLMALGAVMTISQAIAARFRGSNLDAAASEVLVGDAAETSAGKVEAGTATMATSGAANLGRLAGAVGGVALAIGTVAVGSATAHSGAGGAAATSLMGAVSGAMIGLSMGGAFGAAIGGAVGGLAGLALHFHDAASQADGMSTSVKRLSDNLKTALQLDKGMAGAQVSDTLTSWFLQHPATAQEFQKAGIGMSDITSYLASGGHNLGAMGSPLHKALAPGLDASGYAEFAPGTDLIRKYLPQLLQAYGGAASAASSVLALQNTPAYKAPAAARIAGGPGGHTTSQLTAIHHTALNIEHNTRKTAQHAKDTHDAIVRSGSGKPLYSPSLATL